MINKSTGNVDLIGIESADGLHVAVRLFWPSCFAANPSTNDFENCHARLGHASLRTVNGSSKHVRGLTIEYSSSVKVCQVCANEKSTRKCRKQNTKDLISMAPLHRVFPDVVRLFNHPS